MIAHNTNVDFVIEPHSRTAVGVMLLLTLVCVYLCVWILDGLPPLSYHRWRLIASGSLRSGVNSQCADAGRLQSANGFDENSLLEDGDGDTLPQVTVYTTNGSER